MTDQTTAQPTPNLEPSTAPEPTLELEFELEPAEQESASGSEPPTTEPSSEEPTGHWTTTEEAATHLGASVRTIRRWAAEGKLQSKRQPGTHGLQIWIETSPEQGSASEPTAAPETPGRPAATGTEPGTGADSDLSSSNALAIPTVHLDHESLYPLTDLISDLTTKHATAAAEAAYWKGRYQQLEAQLQALPAGDQATYRPWWKRLLGLE